MRPLGFRFDEDAVVLDGTAHRADCPLLPAAFPASAIRVAAGDVYVSQRCPRCCACEVRFETLLGYALRDRGVKTGQG